MKHILSLAFILMISLGFSNKAEAFGGTSEFLEFVAETDIPDQQSSGLLSLCVLKEKVHVLSFPLWFKAKEYALAPERCETDSYYSVDAEMLASGQADGVFPADIPAEPTLSASQKTAPFIWGVLLILGILVNRMKPRGIPQNGARTSGAAHVVQYENRVLEIACRAAAADGVIEPREVSTVGMFAESITNKQVPLERVREMIEFIRQQPEPSDFSEYHSGLTKEECYQLLRIAMMVIGKPGLASGLGKTFVDKLAVGLLVEPEVRDSIAASLD